jgi:hypothetical protein
MADDNDTMGPVDYLVVEFPEGRTTGEGLPLLADLVDRGIIRILDLAFVKKEPDGSIVGVELADLDPAGMVDVTLFEGVASGLLGEDDLDAAGGVLEPGSAAGILVYENAWAAPLASALRHGGAQLVASGRITVPELLDSLEATEGK